MSLVNSLSCITVSCAEPAQLVGLLTDVLDWEICGDGRMEPDLEALWGIASGSADGPVTVLRARGTQFGMIRVVAGKDRRPSRQIGARWSGLEIVVMDDLDGLYAALDSHPSFEVISAPKTYDFTHAGSNIHRSFVGRLPGGTHVVFTMALTKPKLESRVFASADVRVGQVFAAHLVTIDYRQTFGFYRDILRMVPYLEDHLEKGGLHETWSLPDGASVDLGVLRGNDATGRQGAVEMQGHEDRFIDRAPAVEDLLDGGTCLTTFTAAVDLDQVLESVRNSAQATLLSEPRVVDRSVYAGGRSFAFIGPSLERVEICERFEA